MPHIQTEQLLVSGTHSGTLERKFRCLRYSVRFGNVSQDRSLPPSEQMSLQTAHSLNIAANIDRTFSIDQLVTRDLVMVDAFLRRSFYNIIRDAIVEETAMLIDADFGYPRGEQCPIFLIVQAFKELHQAIKKIKRLRMI
ncbi:unnamed protein product [Haemonchus placei]|uniref:Protein-serine/threonine kinase n=1 Tax=Haemonchus placei TaxID=6290 RepID=A0A0N4WEN8_HAEPC|nr:unnamed protein product [Haemonchus placei]